jgi:low affinity Fe/Cu permease
VPQKTERHQPLTEKSPTNASRFSQAAEAITAWSGSARAFQLAVLVIVIWMILGPVCGYSDTWQLTINTGTSIVTFLMVFLIQKAQNRDTRAIHLKLNELIAAVEGASNRLINAEDLDDEAMHRFYGRFQALAETIREEGQTTRSRSIEEVPHSDEDAPTGSLTLTS